MSSINLPIRRRHEKPIPRETVQSLASISEGTRPTLESVRHSVSESRFAVEEEHVPSAFARYRRMRTVSSVSSSTFQARVSKESKPRDSCESAATLELPVLSEVQSLEDMKERRILDDAMCSPATLAALRLAFPNLDFEDPHYA